MPNKGPRPQGKLAEKGPWPPQGAAAGTGACAQSFRAGNPRRLGIKDMGQNACAPHILLRLKPLEWTHSPRENEGTQK